MCSNSFSVFVFAVLTASNVYSVFPFNVWASCYGSCYFLYVFCKKLLILQVFPVISQVFHTKTIVFTSFSSFFFKFSMLKPLFLPVFPVFSMVSERFEYVSCYGNFYFLYVFCKNYWFYKFFQLFHKFFMQKPLFLQVFPVFC